MDETVNTNFNKQVFLPQTIQKINPQKQSFYDTLVGSYGCVCVRTGLSLIYGWLSIVCLDL